MPVLDGVHVHDDVEALFTGVHRVEELPEAHRKRRVLLAQADRVNPAVGLDDDRELAVGQGRVDQARLEAVIG
jgi:hypothetical protein